MGCHACIHRDGRSRTAPRAPGGRTFRSSTGDDGAARHAESLRFTCSSQSSGRAGAQHGYCPFSFTTNQRSKRQSNSSPRSVWERPGKADPDAWKHASTITMRHADVVRRPPAAVSQFAGDPGRLAALPVVSGDGVSFEISANGHRGDGSSPRDRRRLLRRRRPMASGARGGMAVWGSSSAGVPVAAKGARGRVCGGLNRPKRR